MTWRRRQALWALPVVIRCSNTLGMRFDACARALRELPPRRVGARIAAETGARHPCHLTPPTP